MAEQRTGAYDNPYKFNGKELDAETNLYYYGARYYDPRISIFLSVDPLAEKHPNRSPYEYCASNPILLIDPDGRDWIVSKNKTKVHVKVVKEKVDNGLYGLHQALDADGNALNWNSEKGDFDGTPAYVEGEEGVYKEATITVFEGNIEEGGGNGKNYGYNDISTEQEIGHTFGHESNHDSDSEFIQDLRNKRDDKPNKGVDAHDNIDDAGMYKEIHDNNKKD